MADAMRKHPQADVMVNFASLRSAYESVVETMQYPQVGRRNRVRDGGSVQSQCDGGRC